jgi:hypothetical protein
LYYAQETPRKKEDMGTALAKNLATEFLRLLEEGWTPDIDEFLSRVPEQQREHCRQFIEEVAVLDGVTIAAGLSQSEPSSLEELPQEIVTTAEVEPDEPVEVGTEPPEQEAVDEFEAQTPVASADTGSFSPEAEPTEASEAQLGTEALKVPAGTGPQFLWWRKVVYPDKNLPPARHSTTGSFPCAVAE